MITLIEDILSYEIIECKIGKKSCRTFRNWGNRQCLYVKETAGLITMTRALELLCYYRYASIKIPL
jgi:hypothetical protein